MNENESTYYNPERKEAFIETLSEGLKGKNKNFFSQTKYKEEELEKDLCEFTSLDILNYFKELATASLEVLINQKSFVKKYINWCLKEKYIAGQNPVIEISQESLMTCLNKTVMKFTVFSKEDIQKIVNESYTNLFTNFVILALFEGLKGDFYSDITQLTVYDFKPEEGVVIINGEARPISNQLYELAMRCYREKYKYTNKKKSRYVKSEYIFKSTLENTDYTNIKSRKSSFQKEILKSFEEITYNNIGLRGVAVTIDIYRSGAFNFMRERKNGRELKDLLKDKEVMDGLKLQYRNVYNEIKRNQKLFIMKYEEFI